MCVFDGLEEVAGRRAESESDEGTAAVGAARVFLKGREQTTRSIYHHTAANGFLILLFSSLSLSRPLVSVFALRGGTVHSQQHSLCPLWAKLRWFQLQCRRKLVLGRWVVWVACICICIGISALWAGGQHHYDPGPELPRISRIVVMVSFTRLSSSEFPGQSIDLRLLR
jgi:hypothetical protein